MVGITLCDHESHEGVDVPLVRATARIQVWFSNEKNKTEINAQKQYDACDEHLTGYVQDAFFVHHKSKLFVRVTVSNTYGGNE
jgi:hypothetical protein